MTNCAVPGCKENGSHLFPKDKKLKKLWAEAIKRPKLAKSQSLYLKICGHHFTESDYRTVKLSTGFNFQRRKLKENAVPSVFPWSKLIPQEFSDCSSDTEVPETEFLDINKQQSASDSDIGIQDIQDINNKSTQTSVPLRLISTEELLSDDTSINFFTGFETYKKFKFVFSTLCPMAYNLCYKSCNVISLNVEEQFLLTLMKLKHNYCDFELSKIFGVSKSIVSNIFITWVNFMYDTWSLINLWPTQEVVRYYTPKSFKHFQNTRIIVDSIEVPICKPKKPLSQQATFSNHKNKHTIKFLIGATPGGLISYCSDGYGGATSDRQLIERSQLTTLCQAGDTIMADERFKIQEIFAPKGIGDKIPKSKLMGVSQVSMHDLKKNRELPKKRVHIERLLGLTKTYTILKTEVSSYYVPLTSKIFFVCVMLCNFRESVKLRLNK